jgi:protein-disulfide isomerase
MQATEGAKHKFLILDACRDNPLPLICPGLKGKKLSFARIEVGAFQNLLLVTSTQFGQQALDGERGTHSPFAAALMATLEANPSIYFEQVMNEVARGTYEAAQKQERGFVQIPGKLVGGAAPTDCLRGKGCVGDARMAALELENERLSAAEAAASAESARQASQAAKNREVARMQRLLLSPGPIAEIKIGSDNASVMIIEYCGWWSIFCRYHHQRIMPDLKKHIDAGSVQYIYRDLPLDEIGIQTLMIANCLGSSRRPQFVSDIYQLGSTPTRNRHYEAAQRVGLSKERVDGCLADSELRKDVTSMMDRVNLLNITFVPTFFINGEQFLGLRLFEEKLQEFGLLTNTR